MTDDVNYYEVLGIPIHASVKEIKAAYLFLAEMYHPDQGRDTIDEDQRDEFMKRLNAAKHVLTDPIKRTEYDRKMGFDLSDELHDNEEEVQDER